MFKKYMKRSRIMQIENLCILNQENTRELHQNLQLKKKGKKTEIDITEHSTVGSI